MLREPVVLLCRSPALELEVPSVHALATVATLDENERGSAYNRDEVQRQVHDVTDDGIGREFGERAADKLAQTSHGITARLELTAFLDDLGGVLGDKSSIKSVENSILEEEVARDEVDDDGALVQDEQRRGEGGQRSVDKDEDGQLGEIGEEKHEDGDTGCEGQGGDESLEKGLPQRAVREEVGDAPQRVEEGAALCGFGEKHLGLLVVLLSVCLSAITPTYHGRGQYGHCTYATSCALAPTLLTTLLPFARESAMMKITVICVLDCAVRVLDVTTEGALCEGK